MLDRLLDNLWWPFTGGVLIGCTCVAASWAIRKLRGANRQITAIHADFTDQTNQHRKEDPRG